MCYREAHFPTGKQLKGESEALSVTLSTPDFGEQEPWYSQPCGGGGVAWTRDPHSPAGVFCELRFGAVSTGIEGASPVLGARVPLFLVENLKPKAASLLPWWLSW